VAAMSVKEIALQSPHLIHSGIGDVRGGFDALNSAARDNPAAAQVRIVQCHLMITEASDRGGAGLHLFQLSST